jgi:hypothetical protein
MWFIAGHRNSNGGGNSPNLKFDVGWKSAMGRWSMVKQSKKGKSRSDQAMEREGEAAGDRGGWLQPPLRI